MRLPAADASRGVGGGEDRGVGEEVLGERDEWEGEGEDIEVLVCTSRIFWEAIRKGGGKSREELAHIARRSMEKGWVTRAREEYEKVGK